MAESSGPAARENMSEAERWAVIDPWYQTHHLDRVFVGDVELRLGDRVRLRPRAHVMMAGTARDVDISFLTGEEAAEVGDYVLVHVGFAMGKMTAEEALETERMLEDFIHQSRFGGQTGDPIPLSEGRRPAEEVAR